MKWGVPLLDPIILLGGNLKVLSNKNGEQAKLAMRWGHSTPPGLNYLHYS